MVNLILASKSPRRKELLALLDIPFIVDSIEIDETLDASLSLEKAVCDLALRKARVISSNYKNNIVIGADTIVVVDGVILGKPVDKADATKMLKLLSGREHRVITAIALKENVKERVFYSEAIVRFYPLSDEEINRYCESDDPYDKAGAYGIQTKGSLFVEAIKGDYYTIVGLPISLLKRELEEFLK